MEFKILLTNLSNPTILFFLLGVIAVWWKSDLQVPASSSRFISLYLLFSIGFKGGQELSHSGFNTEVVDGILFGIGLAIC
ncbi:MAG: sodium-dependent bicarbonate transport family permease, partial [Bacteroidota bacterium]